MYRKKTRVKNLWIISLILFLFIALNIFTPFSNITKNTFLLITSPVQRILFERGGRLQRTIEMFREAEKVEEEISKLRRENIRLSSRLAMQGEVKEENKALRDALDLDLGEEKEKVFVEVIGKDISRHHLVIRHEKEIKEGDLAISPEGAFVGVISKTYEDFSNVKLITSKKSSFEAKVQNEDSPIGMLKGESGKNLFLDLLPKDKKIEKGDAVVTLPHGSVGVKGIYIGSIQEIIQSDAEAFVQAKVEPGFDARYANFLFVLRK